MTQDDLRSPKIPQNYAYTANSSGKRFIDFTNRHEVNRSRTNVRRAEVVQGQDLSLLQTGNSRRFFVFKIHNK